VKPLPDILEIKPLAKPPNCTITVPGSKSITNRALILAALAKGKCTLRGALWADDTQVMVDSLNKLGIKTTPSKPDENSNCDIEVEGQDGRIPEPKADLYVGNAGTAARFLTALVCLGHGEYKILGDLRMHERPMKDLFDALRAHGVTVDSENNRLPARIVSNGLRRTAEPYNVELTTSTQFASALLLISQKANIQLAFSKWETEEGYLTMTENMIHGGYALSFTPDYVIEPDYSSASYFWAAGFVTEGDVQVAGWAKRKHYLQVDGRFPEHLPPRENVSRRTDLGDSVMTLAICALFGKHPLKITDAARMRDQETDRIKAMVTELRKVGGDDVAEENTNGFIVHPKPLDLLHPADIETYNDHRMAMCFSVLGLKVPGIRIKNPQCVSKTFPNFFEKLEQLRQ
jgi:3-phosphoshikimate 1-carboxyvinyltransferase